MEQKVTTPSQHVWLAQLLYYNFDIVYKRGSENRAADALFRVLCAEILSLAISLISSDLNQKILDSYTDDAGV